MNLLKNKYYLKALEFIASGQLESLPVGKNVIDGDNLFVNISQTNLKKRQDARLEVHNKYIDIQIPLDGAELFGVRQRSECKSPDAPFNAEKDVQFFADEFDDIISAQPGAILVFTPDMAHAPMIGEGSIRKAIFKVKVCEE
ncbi:MAG: YhcH/YjgK/YiaL family protein [Bacteroidales bacterium]|nr:YhcH/YjgK/YiaL family protein [Bacteroidales bacterium]